MKSHLYPKPISSGQKTISSAAAVGAGLKMHHQTDAFTSVQINTELFLVMFAFLAKCFKSHGR